MFKNVFSTKGRIRRAKFGFTLLFSYFAFVFLEEFAYLFAYFIPFSLFFILLIIIIVLQGIKRCHDIDAPGWMVLVPLFNPFVLLFVEGTKGDNQYGKNPKQPSPFAPFAPPSFTTENTTKTTTPPPPPSSPNSAPIQHTYYVISPDGKTLMKWFNTEATVIDMQQDPALSKVTAIGKDVFYDCTKLSKIVFPENLEKIGRYAFDGCEGLHDFVFSENLNYIGEYVFGKNCPIKLIFKGNIPPVLEGDFGYNDDRLQVIYVPFGSAEAYRQAESWKKYAHLIF